jgi:hypothetical protein
MRCPVHRAVSQSVARRVAVASVVVALMVLAAACAGSSHGSGSGSGSAGAAAVPTLSAEPPTGPADSIAGFRDPSGVVPAGAVPSWGGDLTGFAYPPGFGVVFQVGPQKTPMPAVFEAQAEDVFRAWAEAWSHGVVTDARFDSWCVLGCHGVLDNLVTLYGRDGDRPTGTLYVSKFVGLVLGNPDAGEVAGCVDTTGTAVVSAVSGARRGVPVVQGVSLVVLGLDYDRAAGRWVAVSGVENPDDPYCTGGGSSS